MFDGIKYTLVKGNMDTLVNDIVYDSRIVKKGVLFVAIVGSEVDGHKYINDAIKLGATAILVSKNVEIKDDVTVIKVADTRKILAKLAMHLFKYPQSKLKTIAITGTKGKTTTSFMIKRILEEAGYKCGLIGTTGIYIGDKVIPAKNTTPESYQTIKYMNDMVKVKTDFLVMEVSSQALKYDRVNDIIFDYGIFTNLTHDHIGPNEHTDMDDYIKSKAKLFNQCNHGIFNLDDEHFYDMVQGGDANINTYGYDERADLRATKIDLIREKGFIGINLSVMGVINDTFKISSPGKFTSYNAMAAILTCHMIGINNKYIKKALSDFHVKGRVEPVHVADDFDLLIDYAHNGVSTESILSTISGFFVSSFFSHFMWECFTMTSENDFMFILQTVFQPHY